MNGRVLLGFILAVLLSIFACAGQTLAAVWYVVNYTDNNAPPGDGLSWGTAFNTVQAGINAAVSGDEVWVNQGTYNENVAMKDGVGLYGGFNGTETARDQRNWTVNVTTLDGQNLGSVVRIENCPSGNSTIVDGFTIRNGTGTIYSGALYLYGGGIFCNNASPLIQNNIITMNSAQNGGGIATGFYSSSPTIRNNVIRGNSSSIWSGGIYIGVYNRPVISGNIIDNNTAATYAAGIYVDLGSTAIISGNTISGNRLTEYCGGGIAVMGSSPVLSNNTISNNYAATAGGGIFSEGSPIIANNIFVENQSPSGAAYFQNSGSSDIRNNHILNNNSWRGGGLNITGGNTTISNNTIVGNQAVDGGGGIYCLNTVGTISNNIVAFNFDGIYSELRYGYPSTLTLHNNNVFGNVNIDYAGLPPGPADISAYPMFADNTLTDFHLAPYSPCINAGYNAIVQPDWTDLDGEARIMGTAVDIGADEFFEGYVDLTPPVVTETLPADGALGVSLGQVIAVTCSEDIQQVPPNSNILLYDEKRLLPVDNLALNVNGNVLTIAHPDLEKNTLYSVTIPAFSIKDIAGNEMATDKIFYFTTVRKVQ